MHTLFKSLVDTLSSGGEGQPSNNSPADPPTIQNVSQYYVVSIFWIKTWNNFRETINPGLATVAQGFEWAKESLIQKVRGVDEEFPNFHNFPAPENHPFRVLPWEGDLEVIYAPLPVVARAAPEELRSAIKFILSQVTRDPQLLFDGPEPCDNYMFEFDPWRQNFASKMLLIDSELARLRYDYVPSKLSEDQFWRRYFYSIENESLPKIAAKLEPAVEEIRRRATNQVDESERDRQAQKRIEMLLQQREPDYAQPKPQAENNPLMYTLSSIGNSINSFLQININPDAILSNVGTEKEPTTELRTAEFVPEKPASPPPLSNPPYTSNSRDEGTSSPIGTDLEEFEAMLSKEI